jgi:uncharacterized protein involved in exopolysaccharide biosynthesis
MPNENLEREWKVAEENFLLYQKRKEEARIGDEMDRQRILNVSVVENPDLPARPAPGRGTLVMALGFLAATFGSFSCAVVAEYFRRNAPAGVATVAALDRRAPESESVAKPPAAAAAPRKPFSV